MIDIMIPNDYNNNIPYRDNPNKTLNYQIAYRDTYNTLVYVSRYF